MSSFDVAAAIHADRHSTGGADAIDPSDIGALALSGGVVTGDVSFESGRPWFDPIAFGADPSGSTDSTSAFTGMVNALNAAGAGRVKIPHGTFKITSALPSITVPCVIDGDGAFATILSVAAGVPGLQFASAANRAKLSDLSLVSLSTAAGSDNGVSALCNLATEDVYVSGFGNDGFNLDTTSSGNANHSRLSHCRAYQNKRDGFHCAGPNSNVIALDNTETQSNGRWGYYNAASTITNLLLNPHAAGNGSQRSFTDLATTSGVNTVTSASANWVVGDWIVATGIPAGAYVSAIVGTTATFLVDGVTSPVATATATGVTVAVTTGGAFYDNGNGNQYIAAYTEQDGYNFVKLDTLSVGGTWLGTNKEIPTWIQPATPAGTWDIFTGGAHQAPVTFKGGIRTGALGAGTSVQSYTLGSEYHNVQQNDILVTIYVPITALPAGSSVVADVDQAGSPVLRTIASGSSAMATAAFVLTIPLWIPFGCFGRVQLAGSGGTAAAATLMLQQL